MSDISISHANSDNDSSEAMGTLLMIAVFIVWVTPLVIGYWAAVTGGGF